MGRAITVFAFSLFCWAGLFAQQPQQQSLQQALFPGQNAGTCSEEADSCSPLPAPEFKQPSAKPSQDTVSIKSDSAAILLSTGLPQPDAFTQQQREQLDSEAVPEPAAGTQNSGCPLCKPLAGIVVILAVAGIVMWRRRAAKAKAGL